MQVKLSRSDECLQDHWSSGIYFQYRDLTRNEAMNWLQNSIDTPRAVYDIARDVSQEFLRDLIVDASRIGWGTVMDMILIFSWTARNS